MKFGVFIAGLATTVAGVAFLIICYKLGRSNRFFESTWSTQPKLLRQLALGARTPDRFRQGLMAGLAVGGVAGGLLSVIGVISMVTAIR